jgi:hypothetical protein
MLSTKVSDAFFYWKMGCGAYAAVLRKLCLRYYSAYVHTEMQVRSREGFRELVGRTTCFGQQMYAYRSFGLFGEAKVRNALAFCVTPGCICCAEAAVVLLRPFLVDVVRLRLRHYR